MNAREATASTVTAATADGTTSAASAGPPAPTAPTAQPARHRSGARGVAAYVPMVVLAALVLVLLLRTGVSGWDVVRYALYWIVAVVLPGKIVTRALLGVRRTVVEDLALAAITGVCLEVLCWVVGVVTGLGDVVRFWWVLVLLAGLLVPGLRRRTLERVPERIETTQASGLAAIVALVLMPIDLTWFRVTPLPPQASGIFDDVWWHLSLVQEMMRYESPQTPQVAGLPFKYHFFADVQMASGARLSGVAPEVVLMRLWPVFVSALVVGLGFTLARTLTRSSTWAVVSAGVMYALPAIAFGWVGINTFAASLFYYISPSQTLAGAGIVVSALAVVLLLREGPSVRLGVWSAIVIAGSSGDKSTLVPVVAAGAVVALAHAALTRSWATVKLLAAVVGGLAVVGIVILRFAAGTEGGKIVLFGTLRAFPSFTDLVKTPELRAVNDGILLDSIDSPRKVAIAVLVSLVVVGLHGVRIAGLAGLARKHLRADPVVWFLAGAVVAGYGATLVFEQIGLSQIFFAATAAPLGAALTVFVLHDAVERSRVVTWRLLLGGLVLGVGAALVVRAAVAIREHSGGFRALERMVLPPVVVAVVVLVVVLAGLAWRRLRRDRTTERKWTPDATWAVALTAVLGLALPQLATSTWTNVGDEVQPVSYRDFNAVERVSRGDLEAMLWLRDNSPADDVVMTNAQCNPVTARARPLCAARAFWVSAVSGRRVMLEGWAYTDKAQAQQGVGGRTYSVQPAPFPERFRLNTAVFDDSSVSALERARTKYGVRWVVAVRSAGPAPTLPSDVARVRYDNGAVTILEVTGR